MCYVGRLLENLDATVAVGTEAQRHFGVRGRESTLAVSLDEHVGIVLDIAFRYEHIHIVTHLKKSGQSGHAVGNGPFGKVFMGIRFLVRSLEATGHLQMGLGAGGEGYIEFLICHLHRVGRQ